MSSDMYHQANYDRFKGIFFIKSGKVEFGGVTFNNACQAIQVLREISDCANIKTIFIFKGQRGFELDDGRVITVNDKGSVQSFMSKTTARMSIRALKKLGKL